jgi:hypothetical protein
MASGDAGFSYLNISTGVVFCEARPRLRGESSGHFACLWQHGSRMKGQLLAGGPRGYKAPHEERALQAKLCHIQSWMAFAEVYSPRASSCVRYRTVRTLENQ